MTRPPCDICPDDPHAASIRDSVIQVCGENLCQIHYEHMERDIDLFWTNPLQLPTHRRILVPSVMSSTLSPRPAAVPTRRSVRS